MTDLNRITGAAEQSHQKCIRELAETIVTRGWSESAEFITNEIQFIVDVATAGHLSLAEIQTYIVRSQVTVDTLKKVQDGPYKSECRHLLVAVQRLNEVSKSRFNETRLNSPLSHEHKTWSLSKAMAWRDHLDGTLGFYESCCYSWRADLDKFLKERPDHPVLACIQEIERQFPLLRSGRLNDVPAQLEAMEKCTILNAKLTVYSDHLEALRLYFNKIVGPQETARAAFNNMAAFSRAVVGRDLGGEEDWSQQVEPLRWLKVETRRLVSLYDNDGRLDSSEKVTRERAFVDPLYRDAREFGALDAIDRYSLEVIEHPSVHIEIENLEEVLKKAGLNRAQRKALLLRRNGQIMSRKDLNEWKRGERAIGRHRSELIRSITAAARKRVIKAPTISAGSYFGLVREGTSYTFPLPNENQPTQNPSNVEKEPRRWFNRTPPPISATVRKRKYLFKKVSTQK